MGRSHLPKETGTESPRLLEPDAVPVVGCIVWSGFLFEALVKSKEVSSHHLP